jgi:hypothetical protein
MPRETDVRYFRSRKPQSNYNTAVVPSASAPTSHIQVLCDRDASNLTSSPRTGDNSNQATGVDEPDDFFIVDHRAEANERIELNIKEIVRNLYAHFGGLSSAVLAAAGGSDPQVVEHTITRQDLSTSLQPPAYELGRDAGAPIQRRLISCCSRQLGVSLVTGEDNNPRMKLTQQWQGSGLVYEPSALLWQPTSNYHIELISNPVFLTRAHAYLVVGDYDGSGAAVGGTTQALHDCTLRSLDATFTNEFSPEITCPGAGRLFYVVNGALWKASTAVSLNDMLVVGNRIYQVTTAGNTGAGAPTHTSGAAANGTATLTFVNFRGIANWAASTPVQAQARRIPPARPRPVALSPTARPRWSICAR